MGSRPVPARRSRLIFDDGAGEWIAQALRPSNEWNGEERAQLAQSFASGNAAGHAPKSYRRGPCSLGVQPIDDYWQAVPGAHCALNVPCTVTVPAPPTEASVAEKVK